MKNNVFNAVLFICSSTFVFSSAFGQVTIRSLDQAIERAITMDPWQNANTAYQRSMLAQSSSADALPDPKISLGLVNMPTDGFALDQEPMTQGRIGISQVFNRGQSARLRQQQLLALADQYPHLSEDRRASVSVKVSQLWLDGYAAQMSLSMLENDRSLFEQLASTVETQYASAQGITRQDDVIRAKLEVSRLQDRLLNLQSQRDAVVANLALWLMDDSEFNEVDVHFAKTPIEIPIPEPLLNIVQPDSRLLFDTVMRHPAVKAIQQRVSASKTTIDIAREAYQPKWAVNASYGHRQDNQLGQSRADFFSLGVTFEMPLFGTQKQDSSVRSAKHQTEAMETQKRLLVRRMVSQLKVLITQHSHLVERLDGYKDDILPQLRQQAEASLSAYTSDDKPFSDVMHAKIAELNGRLDMISLQVELYKVRKHLQYYLGHAESDNNLTQQPLLGGQ